MQHHIPADSSFHLCTRRKEDHSKQEILICYAHSNYKLHAPREFIYFLRNVNEVTKQ
jgi:hypothetical protein